MSVAVITECGRLSVGRLTTVPSGLTQVKYLITHHFYATGRGVVWSDITWISVGRSRVRWST